MPNNAHRSMLDWLLTGPVRLPSGAYWSWLSDDQPGFLYPEAAAVAARIACWWAAQSADRSVLDRAIPTLSFLTESVGEEGLVWQGDAGYLFDTLLVLVALETARLAEAPFDSSDACRQLAAGAASLLRRQMAVIGDPPADRWSTRFGPHLLKPIGLALRIGASNDDVRAAMTEAVPLLASQQNGDGGFVNRAETCPYLHAHCYALEGLLILGQTGEEFQRGLEFLAAQQLGDGGFPQWPGADLPPAADVTAQAGRLFLLTGRRTDAEAAYRALLTMQAESGALRYRPDLPHENSWATAFGCQLGYGLHDRLESRWLG